MHEFEIRILENAKKIIAVKVIKSVHKITVNEIKYLLKHLLFHDRKITNYGNFEGNSCKYNFYFSYYINGDLNLAFDKSNITFHNLSDYLNFYTNTSKQIMVNFYLDYVYERGYTNEICKLISETELALQRTLFLKTVDGMLVEDKINEMEAEESKMEVDI